MSQVPVISCMTNEDLKRKYFFNPSLQSQTAFPSQLYLGFERLNDLAVAVSHS